jgi:ribosome-binding protein aMBF1 (putative translation factor)
LFGVKLESSILFWDRAAEEGMVGASKPMKTTHSPLYRNILAALIAARKARGVTQTQLAEALGKPQSYVSKVESGERRLDVAEYIELCRALSVHPSQVLTAAGVAP